MPRLFSIHTRLDKIYPPQAPASHRRFALLYSSTAEDRSRAIKFSRRLADLDFATTVLMVLLIVLSKPLLDLGELVCRYPAAALGDRRPGDAPRRGEAAALGPLV